MSALTEKKQFRSLYVCLSIKAETQRLLNLLCIAQFKFTNRAAQLEVSCRVRALESNNIFSFHFHLSLIPPSCRSSELPANLILHLFQSSLFHLFSFVFFPFFLPTFCIIAVFVLFLLLTFSRIYGFFSVSIFVCYFLVFLMFSILSVFVVLIRVSVFVKTCKDVFVTRNPKIS